MDALKTDQHDQNVARIMRLALAQAIPQALKTFVQLGIPDILAVNKATLTIGEISNEIKKRQPAQVLVREEALLSILRLLAVEGIVDEISGPNNECLYRLTAVGSLLLEADTSVSLALMVEYFVDRPIWKAWGELPNFIAGKETESPFHVANGVPSQTFYGNLRNRESLYYANSFVRFISEQEVVSCVNGFDWGSLSNKTVVDIGGFSGQVMKTVAAKFPLLRCICLDLPEVIRSYSSKSPSTDTTVELVAGDMFDYQTIPKCDAIFMKHIVLCDWDESDSLKILQSCSKALPPSGQLIICECVLPDHGAVARNDNDGALSLYVDCFMMLDGRKSSKTAREWERFAVKGGFVVESIVQTAIPTSSIIVMEKLPHPGSSF